MKIHNIEQQSPEWFEIRKAKLSASHAQAIGTAGKGLETYVYKLMSEYFSSGEIEHYSNKHTERGNELEDQARCLYELKTCKKVEEVGFIELDEYVGCSPDGLIGEEGGIEIKCFDDTKHFRLVNGKDKVEKKHIWQIQMNLLITGRKWWSFVAYNPNFEKSLYIEKIEPDEEMQQKLKEGIEKGKKLIQEICKKYKK